MMQPTHKATTLAAAGIVLALAASIPATAQEGGAPAIADEQLGGTVLTIVPSIAYHNALLRVAGPNGYALTQRFEAGTPITVDLVTAGDIPHYAEESPRQSPQAAGLRAGRADDRDEIPLPDGRYAYEVHFTDTTGADHVHRGRFQVRAGAPAAFVEKANGQTVAEDEAYAPTASHATAGEMSGVGGTGEFDEQVNVHDANGNGVTHLSLESTDSPTWFVRNDDGVLELQEDGSNNDGLFVTAGGNARVSSGLAVGSLTANPGEGELELHRSVQETTKSIRAFEFNLSLRSNSASFFPHLSLHTDGGVGIGTGSPEADLDVRDFDGNDFAAFRLTRDSSSWAMSHTPTGVFTFNLIGSGGQEFAVRERLDAVGPTLDVKGSVRGTQFISTSSREVKTAFEAVEPQEILAKVTALPVSAWRYVWEDASARHVGPVAEDFQRLLGLGDGKTIGTVDADGVLLAAVQGLKQLVDETRAAMAAKDAEISALASEVADLEATIDSLATTPTP